ncbi:MAG: TIGR02186 family protein [Rhizobiaceae bacterium]
MALAKMFTCLRAACLALALLPAAAAAQPHADRLVIQPRESIQIGLSTDRVAITSDFTGADLTIFGALENIDPLVARQGRYDVIVVLEGPARTSVVRRKSRVLGMWINTRSETFLNVPASYSMATTRAPQDIATPEVYRQMALGIDNIFLRHADPEVDPQTQAEFSAALRDRKRAEGLYISRAGGVQFLSQNMFRANLALAPSVPVGVHRARAFLFKRGLFVGETSANLTIVKAGMEQYIHNAARNQSLLYGFFAVLLAIATGWAGRIIFRKD